MGKREGAFEFSPVFVVGRLAFPELAVIMEEAGLEDELEHHGCDLRGSEGTVGGSGEVDSIFDLIKEKFNGLIGIKVGLHLSVICKEVGGADVGVGCIEVIKKIPGADVLIDDIFRAKQAEKHGIDSTNNVLLEGLVGSVVLSEKGGGFVVGAVELLGGSVAAVCRNKSGFARIHGSDERSGRESVVDLRGES